MRAHKISVSLSSNPLGKPTMVLPCRIPQLRRGGDPRFRGGCQLCTRLRFIYGDLPGITWLDG